MTHSLFIPATILGLIFNLVFPFFGHNTISKSPAVLGKRNFSFIASIDTMKESRDMQTHPLTENQIIQNVNLSASLNTTHITLDTNWDYINYFRKWANAIHSAGKHIWVRGHPNQWENNNGAVGIMTPENYLVYEKNFLMTNSDIFQSGDIFDPCSEAENGHFFKGKSPWSTSTAKIYNQFLRDSTDTADRVFSQKGIIGVITNIHSTNPWIATHRLEKSTIEKMGVVTIDAYPDQYDTNAAVAVSDRVNDIANAYKIVNVPILLGEFGYSNKIQVSDQLQEQVVSSELLSIEKIPYVIGLNYWVGAGGPTRGGYTNIFTGKAGSWVLRPAAFDLANYFQQEINKKTH